MDNKMLKLIDKFELDTYSEYEKYISHNSNNFLTESNPEFRALIGTSGEHLVCSDLISRGFPAFLTSQGFPYDVVVDTNGKLWKIQVKTTEGAKRRSNLSSNRLRPIYRFAANKEKNLDKVDIFAFVALDTKEIAYINAKACPSIIEFDNDYTYSQDFKYIKEGCRRFKDFPPEKIFNIEDAPETFYYLCTPYSKFPGGIFEAYNMACEMTMELESNGIFVYSPIVHSHGPSLYASKKIKDSYNFWLTIDFKYVKLSKGLIVCKMVSWDESYGIMQEIAYAKSLKIPVLYTNFGEIPVELRTKI